MERKSKQKRKAKMQGKNTNHSTQKKKRFDNHRLFCTFSERPTKQLSFIWDS
jgi:hypothetical protein